MPHYLHELDYPPNGDRQLSLKNKTETTNPQITKMYLQYPGGPPFSVPFPNKSLLVLAFQKSHNLEDAKKELSSQMSSIETEQRGQELLMENGRVGALFASKAIVQLMVNPLVGLITSKCGYQLPFVVGSGILCLSSIRK